MQAKRKKYKKEKNNETRSHHKRIYPNKLTQNVVIAIRPTKLEPEEGEGDPP